MLKCKYDYSINFHIYAYVNADLIPLVMKVCSEESKLKFEFLNELKLKNVACHTQKLLVNGFL